MTWQNSYSIFNTLDDAMAFMSCSDGSDDLVLFYRHIWKAAGHSIFENLERAGHIDNGAASAAGNLSFKVIGSLEFCGNFDPRNSRHFAFTFVRDPISRFLAGYSEIEKRVREQRPGFQSLIKTLEQYPAGSVLRATAFFQEFLKNGINGDGHVKPQVEYLGQSQGCSIPMRFVGRVENITIDWPRMFHDAHCDQRNFDTALGLHPNDPRDRSSMEALIRNPSEEYGPFALASTDEVTSAATSLQKREVASMQEVLTKSSALHLRTLCWIYLPDFAVFRYEPPQLCQEEPALREILQQIGPRSGSSAVAALLRLTRAKGDGRGTQEASQIVLATDVHLLNASDLANTVWTCGKLQVKAYRSFSDAVRRRALEILVEFAATDFAKTAWGFARLRDFHEAFFDALGHASCARHFCSLTAPNSETFDAETDHILASTRMQNQEPAPKVVAFRSYCMQLVDQLCVEFEREVNQMSKDILLYRGELARCADLLAFQLGKEKEYHNMLENIAGNTSMLVGKAAEVGQKHGAHDATKQQMHQMLEDMFAGGKGALADNFGGLDEHRQLAEKHLGEQPSQALDELRRIAKPVTSCGQGVGQYHAHLE
eukprot:symbB.v1.2.025142.t1/scaffold2424.1/size79531/4